MVNGGDPAWGTYPDIIQTLAPADMLRMTVARRKKIGSDGDVGGGGGGLVELWTRVVKIDGAFSWPSIFPR